TVISVIIGFIFINAKVSSVIQSSTTVKLTYLISGSADKTIIIWNLTSNENQRTLYHGSSVRILGVLPGTQPQLFSGAYDGTIKEWQTSPPFSNTTAIRGFSGHRERVHSFAFIEGQNPRLFSASYDNTVKEWDITHDGSTTSFRTISYQTDIETVAVLQGSPPRLFIGADDNVTREFDISLSILNGSLPRLYSTGGEGLIKIWDLSSNSTSQVPIRTIRPDVPFKIYCVLLQAESLRLFTGSDDGLIREWNVSSSSSNSTNVNGTDSPVRSFNHNSPVFSVAIYGSRLFSAGGDNLIKEWNIEQRSTNTTSIRTFAGHGDIVNSLKSEMKISILSVVLALAVLVSADFEEVNTSTIADVTSTSDIVSSSEVPSSSTTSTEPTSSDAPSSSSTTAASSSTTNAETSSSTTTSVPLASPSPVDLPIIPEGNIELPTTGVTTSSTTSISEVPSGDVLVDVDVVTSVVVASLVIVTTDTCTDDLPAPAETTTPSLIPQDVLDDDDCLEWEDEEDPFVDGTPVETVTATDGVQDSLETTASDPYPDEATTSADVLGTEGNSYLGSDDSASTSSSSISTGAAAGIVICGCAVLAVAGTLLYKNTAAKKKAPLSPSAA
ncbi:hypothetical protein HK096_006374, partial [Nowakowskiella sp. JEL0078]